MSRRVVVLVAATALLALTPGVASADVIFAQADGESLATTLAEAYDKQGVCYGWTVEVNNAGVPDSSTGSNFGYGRSLSEESGSCSSSVEFQASITWTSESSEAEDSATYSVVSLPSGPSTADLDSLEIISTDGLKGDNVDADVYKAVAALPLLAADSGIAEPIEASPAPEAESGDAVPTDSPTSDFWRQSGTMVLMAALLLLGGGVFAWIAFRSSRGSRRRFTPVGPPQERIPEYIPPDWTDTEPTTPMPARRPEDAYFDLAGPAEPTEDSTREPTENPTENPTAEPTEPGKPATEPDHGTERKSDPETRPEG